MMQKRDNYQLQAAQARKWFLTYDQQELIHRCRLEFDQDYLYTTMLSECYRIHRRTGDLQRKHRGSWVDGNSFAEVMTLLDWLCDSRTDRYITGRWVNIVSQGHFFHSALQEEREDPDAAFFEQHSEAFCQACEALGGEKMSGGDISYAIELVDGLRILVQLWFADEEFGSTLRIMWDENTLRYLRYETTWYAVPLLLGRIKENMAI